VISWEANDNSNNTFTLEYSLDNGSSWNLITSTVPATDRTYYWNVPTVFSNNARVRVTRNGGGATATSTGNFVITNLPVLTLSNPCEGYADLNWVAIPGATDYEVFQLINEVLTPIATTNTLTYQVGGLNKSTTYWFSVRARIADSAGRRAVGRSIRPSFSSPCSGAAFNNDLKIDTMLAPANGRTNTSSQLSNESITVRIKNLDDAAVSGGYTVSYQIDMDPVVNELVSTSIAPGATLDYTFATTYNFSAVKPYTIKVWVKNPGDTQTANDEYTAIIKQVDNPALLTLPFTEDFESTDVAEYRQFTFGIPALDRFDFTPNFFTGRLRTFMNSSMTINGNRSLTLDCYQYRGNIVTNDVTSTFNLSNFSATPGLRFDVDVRNQGQLKIPGSAIFMRGADTQPWVQVYDLSQNQGAIGEIKKVWIDINEVMSNAGQSITSSFQVRFVQAGRTSSNNKDYNPEDSDMDDGFTFDDLRLQAVTNDLSLVKIVAPDSLNCGAGNASVTIQVKNSTGNSYTNVPVAFRIHDGTSSSIVNGSIPVINANSTTNYTFPTPANLTTFGTYILDAWVKEPTDTYPVNDSAINYVVYNSPVISTFPYLEGFENSNGNYFTTKPYSSWKWGSTNPSTRITLSRHANGTKGWMTNLAGTYKANEDSYLYSPCFDLSSLTNPVLSFSHISRQEDLNDTHTIEYTTNNGATWQKLGTQGQGTNWFDQPAQIWGNSLQRWHVSSINIPTTASSVRFRFYFSSDELTQREGVGIDDIHIFERETIYSGADVTNLTQPVNGNGFVDFKSGGNLVASIHPMGQNLGTTEVSAYINSGPIRHINNQYYLDRNLVIRTANAPSDSVIVRFYFTEQEAVKLIQATGCGTCSTIPDAYLAGVTKYSGPAVMENGTLMDNFAGSFLFIPNTNVAIVPFNNGYYAEFKVRSFSEFWINGGGISFNQPLPVTLLDFKVAKNAPHADLLWKTAQETNSDRFEIERSFETEQQFLKIGTVMAAGQSAQPISYQFRDDEVLKKANRIFYRLKMIDNDGRFTYSSTLFINNDLSELFIDKVYPINNSQVYIVTGNYAQVRDIQVRLLSTTGQVVLSQRMPYENTRVNINHLAPGTYIMEITESTGKQRFLQKITKL
jgi:hypothetical protein